MTIPWTKILGALILCALAAALVAGCWYGYEHWRGLVFDEGDKAGAARVQHKWDEDKGARDGALMAAIELARHEEQQAAADAAKGERDAREKAERAAVAARRDAAAATAAGRGLRDSIAGLNAAATAAGVPDAAACPAEFVRQRDAAVRARDLLGACSTRYVELAGAVDDAFAAIQLRLDTALSYIRAVAPP